MKTDKNSLPHPFRLWAAYIPKKNEKNATDQESILKFTVTDSTSTGENEGRALVVISKASEPAVGDAVKWDDENGPAVTGTYGITGDSGSFTIVAEEGKIKSCISKKSQAFDKNELRKRMGLKPKK
jgi:hypothetical protein